MLVFEGAYVPLTMEGNIVVDGVLASCYASIDHDMAHMGMTYMRWIPEIINCIFGNDPDLPSYLKIAQELNKWIMPFEQQT